MIPPDVLRRLDAKNLSPSARADVVCRLQHRLRWEDAIRRGYGMTAEEMAPLGLRWHALRYHDPTCLIVAGLDAVKRWGGDLDHAEEWLHETASALDDEDAWTARAAALRLAVLGEQADAAMVDGGDLDGIVAEAGVAIYALHHATLHDTCLSPRHGRKCGHCDNCLLDRTRGESMDGTWIRTGRTYAPHDRQRGNRWLVNRLQSLGG